VSPKQLGDKERVNIKAIATVEPILKLAFIIVLLHQKYWPHTRHHPPRRTAELKQVSRVKAALFRGRVHSVVGRRHSIKRDKPSFTGLIIGIHIFLSQLEVDSDCTNSLLGIAGRLDRFKFPFESSGYGSRAQ
jgi:hypothetical protein